MVDAEHCAVCGPSGGGKSTLLRKWHDDFDGASYFLTTKPNETRAVVRPPLKFRKSRANYPEDLEAVRRWALKQPRRVQIIVDEAHNAPSFQSGEGPLDSGIREDRERGVEYKVATQNPMNFNEEKDGYGLVQQCRFWVFCGEVRDFHIGFLNANGLSDMIPYLPRRQLDYVILNPVASLTPEQKIVERGRTDPRYG